MTPRRKAECIIEEGVKLKSIVAIASSVLIVIDIASCAYNETLEEQCDDWHTALDGPASYNTFIPLH